MRGGGWVCCKCSQTSGTAHNTTHRTCQRTCKVSKHSRPHGHMHSTMHHAPPVLLTRPHPLSGHTSGWQWSCAGKRISQPSSSGRVACWQTGPFSSAPLGERGRERKGEEEHRTENVGHRISCLCKGHHTHLIHTRHAPARLGTESQYVAVFAGGRGESGSFPWILLFGGRQRGAFSIAGGPVHSGQGSRRPVHRGWGKWRPARRGWCHSCGDCLAVHQQQVVDGDNSSPAPFVLSQVPEHLVARANNG